MASLRQAFHGVEHLGLLLQIPAGIGQGALGLRQGHAQVFCLRHIAHAHHDAVICHAPCRQIPGQQQPCALTHYLAAIQRHTQARHCAQLLHQRGVRQLVKHHLRQHAFLAHQAQARHAARGCIGGPEVQAILFQAKLQQPHGHGIQQRLHAPMCEGAHQGVSLGIEKICQQFGRNHDRSGTSAKLEERVSRNGAAWCVASHSMSKGNSKTLQIVKDL